MTMTRRQFLKALPLLALPHPPTLEPPNMPTGFRVIHDIGQLAGSGFSTGHLPHWDGTSFEPSTGLTYTPASYKLTVGTAGAEASIGQVFFATVRDEASFAVAMGGSTINGQRDDTLAWGFNVARDGGGRQTLLAPYLANTMESYYDTGDGRVGMEENAAFSNTGGGYTLRHKAFYINRASSTDENVECSYWWRFGVAGQSFWRIDTPAGGKLELSPVGVLALHGTVNDALQVTPARSGAVASVTYGIQTTGSSAYHKFNEAVGIGMVPDYSYGVSLDITGSLGLNGGTLYPTTRARLTPTADTASATTLLIGRRTAAEQMAVVVGYEPNGADTSVFVARTDTDGLRLMSSSAGYTIDSVAAVSPQTITLRTVVGATIKTPVQVSSNEVAINPGASGYSFNVSSNTEGGILYVPATGNNVGVRVSSFGVAAGVLALGTVQNMPDAPLAANAGAFINIAGALYWYGGAGTLTPLADA